MKNFTFIILTICILAMNFLFAQNKMNSAEISSSIPELFSFHDVIYPIWHTAYPNKDYALLKQLLPEVNSGSDKIFSAKLPGILRDKEKAWLAGLDKFKISVSNYNKACEENNEVNMLTSAETLHSDYEMLVRIVKPVTKEVDEFHKVLYMIYHHYGPDMDTVKLNKAIDDLVMRAGELKNCVLPKWATNKKDDFTKAANELYNSTKDLQELNNSDAEDKQLEKAIDQVHTNYQKLEALFD
jgi:hypothetical protein